MQSLEKNVNFENENSRKAYYREFKKVRRCSIRAHSETYFSPPFFKAMRSQ